MNNQKILLTIILPTYNESNNVTPILEAVSKVMYGSEYEYEVLFVDDSSDNTPDVIKQYADKYTNVRMLHRPKEERTGLATAFVAGFEHAHGELILCMDSDLQHPPEIIPDMVNRLEDTMSDIVVASRYVPGGSSEGLGGAYRQLVSRATKYFTWLWLTPTRKTTDPGAGMFIFKKSILKEVNFRNMAGFKILLDMLTRIPDARVADYPMVFRVRENDESKASIKQGLHYLRHVMSLFWQYRIGKVLNVILVIIGIITSIFIVLQSQTIFQGVIITIALFLITQSLFMVYLMLYAWEDPETTEKNRSPKEFLEPEYTFTALIPARHEEAVIADTIRSAARINYPDDMHEIFIMINRKDDAETIRLALEAVAETGKKNIKVIDFDGPLGKQRGLNMGLFTSTSDVVTIFDAEDEVHPDLFHVVNTVMLSNDVDVVQSGVQLMNFDTNWYSMYNVLEYYFWFKSVLHFFAKNGVVPLGGNTVFFKRKYLNHVGGWDEACLTEDADIGMRLSLAGAKMKIVYDEIHATREETPPTVWEFVKQRTRWDQGFMQVIGKLDWARLPSFKQKFLAIYALGWVVAQGFLFLIIPFSIYIGMTTKMHPGLSILTNLPMYSLLVIFIILNIGLYEFTKSYGLKYSWTTPFKMLIYYIPFQLLLGFSALRAMWRQIAGQVSWEKTTHLNIARSK